MPAIRLYRLITLNKADIYEKITNNREYFFSTIAIPLQKNKKIDKYEAEKNIWDNIDIVLFRKYLFAKD